MHTWILLLGAGIVCSFLNAAASSGSALTLPLLLML
jgi:cytochrome bd-type quinol oxidase subunit 2